jgi:Tfp pilus assembly protein PilX
MKPLHPLQNEDGIVLVTALIMVVILTVLMTGAYVPTSN